MTTRDHDDDHGGMSWRKVLPGARGDRMRRRRRDSFQATIEPLERMILLSSLVVSNTNDSGPGSLRRAINDSNGATGQTNSISFNIDGTGVQNIAVLSALPDVTTPVVIDATTVEGYTTNPLISIDGTSAGAGASGLVIDASATGTVVRCSTFTLSRVTGSTCWPTTSCSIPPTSSARARSGNPRVPEPGNRRGGPGERHDRRCERPHTDETLQVFRGNLVSGNGGAGILLAGSGMLVEGNWIGVNATGTSARQLRRWAGDPGARFRTPSAAHPRVRRT